MAAYSFNSQQFQPQFGGQGGLPVGPNGEPVDYLVHIKESSLDDVANNGGQLVLMLECLDGPQKGVVQRLGLTLHHSNPKVVEIANKQLSAICHVTGKYQFNDSQELHGIPFVVTIGQQKNDPLYTEVKAVKDRNGNAPGKAGAGPQVQQQAPVVPQQSPQGFAADNQGFAPQPQPQQPTTQGGQWGGPQAQQPAAQTGWGNPAASATASQPQVAGGWGQPQQQPATQGGWGQR